MKMKIVKDQGGQGNQIDGNGKTSGEVNNSSFISFESDSVIIALNVF